MNSYRELYKSCRLCPRECRVDRSAGETGFCGESDEMRLAWAGLHKGEEPPVSGAKGSGTLFFTGCTLRCAFCQNRQLSRGGTGRVVSPRELSDIMLSLQDEGAENINLVTGSQFIPGILEALKLGEEGGLSLPLVWNTSGYEKPDSLKLMEGRINLWLPDMKTLDSNLSNSLFHAPDYPEWASRSIHFMAASGVSGLPWEGASVKMILRHLILPGFSDSTEEVLKWYAKLMKKGGSFLLSLMTQYTPVRGGDTTAPGRMLTGDEALMVYDLLDELGIEEGFFQGPPEEEVHDENNNWEPDFNRDNPFPEGWARCLWHWKN
ncbi:MAG: radical SAM protein [Spirochaetales bacterium]|nr:radical SAM protein [Spirochaetales bacterium]